jgi:hypothetical protein
VLYKLWKGDFFYRNIWETVESLNRMRNSWKPQKIFDWNWIIWYEIKKKE